LRADVFFFAPAAVPVFFGGRGAGRGTRRRLHAPKRRLQVVEDEADGGIAPGRGRDRRLSLADDEHAALPGGDLELRQGTVSGLDLLGRRQQLRRRLRELAGAARVSERRACDLARLVEDDRGLDLRGDLGQIGQCLLCVHRGEA
jgi:hypothetical protein